MNTETEYTNKQKLESQGFIRTRHGVYKLTALEQIYRKGCLEYSETTYGGQDRLRAGEKLSSDYEKSHFSTVNSGWQNDKIDSGHYKLYDSDVNYIRSRYLTAVRSIPREFWPAVRQICIENKIPNFEKETSSRKRTQYRYLWYCDLCRGLDRLIDHYRRHKIHI